MQKPKTHTLITRGVSKDVFHSLKRLAKKNNQSVNGYLLSSLTFATEDERKEFEENKTNKK